MNYFLILIMLGLCGGGYYEITANQKQIAGDQQQIADLQGKLDSITAADQKLEADNAQLKKSSTEAQTEVADLTQQVQTAQTALAEARQPAARVSAPSTPAAPVAVAPSNNLGNLTTLDGKSYLNCMLLKVEPDGIVVNDSTGITQVPFGLMPPDLQKRFGFDSHVAPALTDDQVEALEAKRKAAAQVAGN